MAIIMAHPCSRRGAGAQLRPAILAAAAEPQDKTGPGAWTRGPADKPPLPELAQVELFAGRLDLIGRSVTVAIEGAERIACASQYGVNLLQQRLVLHLTRLEVPTFQFNQAFAHTYGRSTGGVERRRRCARKVR